MLKRKNVRKKRKKKYERLQIKEIKKKVNERITDQTSNYKA